MEKDALADLIVVDGDPIADITVLEKPETSLTLIMKGVKIFKNRIEGRKPPSNARLQGFLHSS